jgi:hypothetical protein
MAIVLARLMIDHALSFGTPSTQLYNVQEFLAYPFLLDKTFMKFMKEIKARNTEGP